MGIDLGKMNIHHTAFLRQVFESMNGLTPEFIERSVNYFRRRLGIELGFDPSNALAIPDLFHPRIHALINKQIAGSPLSWNLKGIEVKFNLSPDWKNYTEYGQRLKIYREIARVIGDSVRNVEKFWRGLESRTALLGKLSKEEFIEITLDIADLDKRLTGLPSPGMMPSKPGVETATDILNDILTNAGKADLSLPSFQKLDIDQTKKVAKVLMQENGADALIEAIVTGQSPDAVFKAHNVIFDGNKKTWRRILELTEIKDLERSRRGGIQGVHTPSDYGQD